MNEREAPQNPEPVKIQPQCRLCLSYYYDRDIDVFTFKCEKGYFDFEESPEGQTGRLPEKGDYVNILPCDGAGFELNEHSQWYPWLAPPKKAE
jgi:hypothetical protein